MQQVTSPAASLAGLVALLGLLLAPTLHGPLGHVHADCASTGAELCLDAGTGERVASQPAEACPVCAVAGQARSAVLASSEARPLASPEEPRELGSAPRATLASAPLLSRSAPRAPPAA